jgi:hypothetical protein
MSTTPSTPQTQEDVRPISGEITLRQSVIGWSSFFFALLHSICGGFVAVNGLRLAIGIGSLVMGAGAEAFLDRFHGDWIRRPMMAIALFGALLNLALFLHVRYLRNRPASQWRRQPVSPRKLRMERLQLALSLATLVLLGIEVYFHFGFYHSI